MTVLIAMAATGVRWALPALIVFVACDQGFWGYSYVYRWGPIQRIDELVAAADVPAAAQPGELIAPAMLGGSGNVARAARAQAGDRLYRPRGFIGPRSGRSDDSADRGCRAGGKRDTPGRAPRTTWRARAWCRTAQPSADIRADVRRIDVARVRSG